MRSPTRLSTVWLVILSNVVLKNLSTSATRGARPSTRARRDVLESHDCAAQAVAFDRTSKPAGLKNQRNYKRFSASANDLLIGEPCFCGVSKPSLERRPAAPWWSSDSRVLRAREFTVVQEGACAGLKGSRAGLPARSGNSAFALS